LSWGVFKLWDFVYELFGKLESGGVHLGLVHEILSDSIADIEGWVVEEMTREEGDSPSQVADPAILEIYGALLDLLTTQLLHGNDGLYQLAYLLTPRGHEEIRKADEVGHAPYCGGGRGRRRDGTGRGGMRV
jgi:hypothetical protein